MITEDDITAIILNPRMRSWVLALLRSKLRDEDDKKPLVDGDHLRISIKHAALKYDLTNGDIMEAIEAGRVVGDANGVDERHLRTWLYGEGVGPTLESEKPPQAPKLDQLGDVISLNDAALILNLTLGTASSMASKGKLVRVGINTVTKASVIDRMQDMLPVRTDTPSAGKVEEIRTADAAKRIGVRPASFSAMTNRGTFHRTRWGYVTLASVEAYEKKQAKKEKAPLTT